MAFDPSTIDFYRQLFTGAVVDGFRVNELISTGEFGLVFAGADTRTEIPVAVKVMPANTDDTANFEFKREGQLLERLRTCSNVVDMLKTGETTVPLATGAASVNLGIRYHILEFADGCLEDMIATPEFATAISPLDKLRLWRQIVIAIHQMHLKKTVHRDLKSSNCLLFGDGVNVRCKVADLGRSRDLTKPQRMNINYINGRGDTRFAAPEHIFMQGQTSDSHQFAVDLYGLGSVFFELFTGLGITSTVIPKPRQEMLNAMAAYRRGQIIRLEGLRSRYRTVVEGLASALPSPIRIEASNLLMQLCDPVPERRFPPARPNRKREEPPALNWLIRRVDILIRALEVAKNVRPAATSNRRT